MRPFARVFADGTSEQRYIREIVFGRRTPVRRTPVRSYQLTTDPAPLRQPEEETTWYLKTTLPARQDRAHSGPHVWAAHAGRAYGFKQAKDELGWADYRLTDAHRIARWWELVMSAYTLVSLQSLASASASASARTHQPTVAAPPPLPPPITAHPHWAADAGWKHQLNNLRLLLQPYVCLALLLPWLHLFDLPHLQRGLTDACALMNAFHLLVPT